MLLITNDNSFKKTPMGDVFENVAKFPLRRDKVDYLRSFLFGINNQIDEEAYLALRFLAWLGFDEDTIWVSPFPNEKGFTDALYKKHSDWSKYNAPSNLYKQICLCATLGGLTPFFRLACSSETSGPRDLVFPNRDLYFFVPQQEDAVANFTSMESVYNYMLTMLLDFTLSDVKMLEAVKDKSIEKVYGIDEGLLREALYLYMGESLSPKILDSKRIETFDGKDEYKMQYILEGKDKNVKRKVKGKLKDIDKAEMDAEKFYNSNIATNEYLLYFIWKKIDSNKTFNKTISPRDDLLKYMNMEEESLNEEEDDKKDDKK